MNDAGLICIAAFVSPREEIRSKVADFVGADRFFVVHVAAPIEVCRERDTEGRYERADRGEIANFPGVSAPYEPPSKPDLVLPTHELPVDQCVDQILALLEQREILK
jgi:bifunctional enzyme CysN/CysC